MGLDQVSTEQITTTAKYRIDTRFNEYISHATPQMRPVLRELRDKVINDLAWIAMRSSGVVAPLEHNFIPRLPIETKTDS